MINPLIVNALHLRLRSSSSQNRFLFESQVSQEISRGGFALAKLVTESESSFVYVQFGPLFYRGKAHESQGTFAILFLFSQVTRCITRFTPPSTWSEAHQVLL